MIEPNKAGEALAVFPVSTLLDMLAITPASLDDTPDLNNDDIVAVALYDADTQAGVAFVREAGRSIEQQYVNYIDAASLIVHARFDDCETGFAIGLRDMTDDDDLERLDERVQWSNAFAHAYLMPQQAFRDAVKRFSGDPSSVARRFTVPESEVRRRASTLGITLKENQ